MCSNYKKKFYKNYTAIKLYIKNAKFEIAQSKDISIIIILENLSVCVRVCMCMCARVRACLCEKII